jgi:hypothetical protein
MGHAQVQRVIEPLADLFVGIDHQHRIDALGADDDVVEILSWKISRYSSSLAIMMARKWPCLLSEKTPPSSFMRFCLSLRSTMEPSLTPTRMGIFLALQAWMTSLTWAAIVDVAGVEADLVNAGFDGFQGPLEMEMDIGDDRHRHRGRISLRAACPSFPERRRARCRRRRRRAC